MVHHQAPSWEETAAGQLVLAVEALIEVLYQGDDEDSYVVQCLRDASQSATKAKAILQEKLK